MTLEKRIAAGQNGDYEGLENGFNRVNTVIYGTQRSCIVLLGGISGTYKTTLANFMILNSIDDAEAKNIPMDVLYCSYEISELDTKMNWLSNAVFKKHNVVISPEKIKGFGKNRLTVEEKRLVDIETDYINKLVKKIKFFWSPMTVKQLGIKIRKHFAKKGTFTKIKDENGEETEVYLPNNPLSYNILVIDHILLCALEDGQTDKEMLDALAKMLIPYSRICGLTVYLVSQFNDGLNSIERMKLKGADLSPQRTDFKGSRGPYEAADIVIGMMCPLALDLELCLDYDVESLGENFLVLKVIKNRLGPSNRSIGIMVDPKSGTFTELKPI